MRIVPAIVDAARAIACVLVVSSPWLALAADAVAQEIVLGQTTATTSPIVGSLSRDYNAGIALAIARANAAGGVRGHHLRLVSIDDGYDASKTVPLVQELVEKDNVVALVGVMGSQPTLRLAADKVLEGNHLALFGPMTGLQSALSQPNVFPIRGSFEDEVRAMMEHCASLGRHRVLFLYYEAGAGPGLASQAPDMARAAHVALSVAGFPVVADGARQQAAVRRALDASPERPDAVILLAIGTAHSEAVKVLRRRFGEGAQGMPIYSLGQVDPAVLARDVGSDRAWGVILSQVMPKPGSVGLEVVREFDFDRRRFAPTLAPGYAELEGYICGRVTVEVLKRATSLTRDGVLQAAEQTGQMDVGGFRVLYGPRLRRSINPIELTMVDRTGTLIH